METEHHFDLQDDHGISGGFAEEIRIEVDEELNGLTELTAEADELIGEVKLGKGLAEPALLYYLGLYSGEYGWYRNDDDNRRNALGLVVQLSSDVGIDSAKARSIMEDWLAQGMVEAEKTDSENGDMITSVRLTGLGLEAFTELLTTRPEDVDSIENFLIYRRHETALMVQQEINHEHGVLGEEPEVFEDLAGFPGIRELNAYLARLMKMQAELEQKINDQEIKRRTERIREASQTC